MNFLQLILVFLFFILNNICFSWGFFAHQRINRLAVFTLPPEMIGFYKKHIVYLTENAVNPDRRRYAVEGEAEKHYIDIDIYGDSAVYKMPRYWAQAVAKYSEDTLKAYGINPWHVARAQKQLTYAFKTLNAKEILRISADLGHYVADGNVPLHTTHNYNGQYTNQYGIHGFWESRLPELFSDSYDFFTGKADYVSNVQLRAWDATVAAHIALDSVLRFEMQLTAEFPEDRKYSYEERNGLTTRVYSKDFSAKYHQMLNGQVERRMRASIKMTGDLWFTAWVDAGQPDLKPLLNFKHSKEDIEEMKRENELWKQELLKVRPETGHNNELHHKGDEHLDCCGHHHFYTLKCIRK